MSKPRKGVVLPFKYFDWQKDIIHSPAQNKVICCGRQSGKTFLCAYLAFVTAFHGGAVLWTAPILHQSDNANRYIRELVKTLPNSKSIAYNAHKSLWVFPSGGRITIKSAKEPDSLRSDTLDLVIIDEAAFAKEEIWNAVSPSLGAKNGKAIIISTPNGFNWFHDFYKRGNSSDFPTWESWHFSTEDANPFFSNERIEEAKADPLVDFEREYLALFTDSGWSVFQNVEHSILAVQQTTPIPNHTYFFSIDWGKVNDYTVISVFDTSLNPPSLVHVERFKQLDYTFQKEKVKSLYESFQPYKIMAERNAMGEPLIDDLKHAGLPIEGVFMAYQNKVDMIYNLALSLSNSELHIFDYKPLLEELQSFTAKKSKNSDTLKLSHPSGMNDDCVMSLAIGWYALKKNAGAQIMTFNRNAIGI